MERVSADYARWARRAMSWVRRKGGKVWEWTPQGGVSPFDVDLPICNTVYALPGALAVLSTGGRARATAKGA